MSPKEKAKVLVDKFQDKIEIDFEQYSNYFIQIELSIKEAKDCAIIAVDEILEYTKEPVFPMGGATGYDYDGYWEEVKVEIELL